MLKEKVMVVKVLVSSALATSGNASFCFKKFRLPLLLLLKCFLKNRLYCMISLFRAKELNIQF